MQIVINVDNELYEYFSKRRSMHDDGYFSHIGKLIKALRDGTLLPKGHGRILDEKDILDTENNDGGWYDLVDMPEYIAGVKAIIEADTESEEISDRNLKMKWIPCSERLPEDKTYVLTTIKIPNRIAHVRSGWYENGFFYNDNGDTWKVTDMEVIGWIPLPAPCESQEV